MNSPHQHEQRNDRELVGTQCLVGRTAKHCQHHVESAAGNQEYPERAGHAQGDGNVHAQGDHHQQADDEDNGYIDVKQTLDSS